MLAGMAADGTVEFNADRPPGWLDRLLGEPDQRGMRRLSGPALGLALLAVAFVLAAELLPWAVNATSIEPGGPVTVLSDLHIEQVAGLVLIPYYLGWFALAALIGIGLVARRSTRRLVVAAGAGCAAAQLVVVSGVARRVQQGTDVFGSQQGEASMGPAVFFAFGAVALCLAALVLTGWRPGLTRGDRRPVYEPEEDPGPADLTVTPLP